MKITIKKATPAQISLITKLFKIVNLIVLKDEIIYSHVMGIIFR
jgi:hypothetical protein